MNDIETFIIKKYDASSTYFNIPKSYGSFRNETKIAYLLLNALHYKNFKKFINMDTIVRDENGKPIFSDKDLYFNISHSKDYIACSLAPVNIGIDIEQDRVIKANIIEKIKHHNDENISLIELWNIKEAYSKYLGIGLKLDFSKISIEDIKEKSNTKNDIYNIDNEKLYFAMCYDKKQKLNNNLTFITKEKLHE